MSLNSDISIKQIRASFIKNVAYQFLPFLIIGLSKSWLEQFPKEITSIFSLIAIILFAWGYIGCWMLAYKYAIYKGYPKFLGLLGSLTIVGLSILFFLKDRNRDLHHNTDLPPLLNVSIFAIFISNFAIEILFMPMVIIGLIFIGNVEPKAVGGWLENEDFLAAIAIPGAICFAWYFFRNLKQAKINYQHITGSFKKIDFKLPILLAVFNYLFASSSSSMILYVLTFIFPNYAEGQINKVYATTPLGYIFFAIAALIFAPIMEELFYRGIIFQKLAITKEPIEALVISASLFTLVHFRYDVISLFIIGVVTALLYLKTKQIIAPIICHFVYNLIVVIRIIHYQFFSDISSSGAITIAKYQQEFTNNLNLYILFIAISLPFLGYFIYNNFPRNYDIKRLPYFVNQ